MLQRIGCVWCSSLVLSSLLRSICSTSTYSTPTRVRTLHLLIQILFEIPMFLLWKRLSLLSRNSIRRAFERSVVAVERTQLLKSVKWGGVRWPFSIR
ncbi:hypothetical protein PMAYCL1PPCAC_00561, partial [Pristionchus mayeri]